MAGALRWLGYIVGALLLVLLIVAAWLWFASNQKLNALATPRAERLVRAPRTHARLHQLSRRRPQRQGLYG